MKKIVATLGLLLFGLGSLYAVTAYTGCPDFTDLTASYVEPYASGVGNQLVKGRHSVIDKQGTDPRTGGKLQLLPKGVDKVIRLGDELGGNQNESLTYHFIPTWDASLIKLSFAVVFENPEHPLSEQPFFSITVTDKNGNLLRNTFSYEVYAKNGLSGFQEYLDGKSPVMWRDWTEEVIDLGAYIDQEVLITFRTRDCLQNGHYAYAYFSASCVPDGLYAKILCLEKTELSVIDGFESYAWNDGSTSNVFEGDINDALWCDMTSIVGLITRLFVSIADPAKPTEDIIYDEVCEGDDYYWNGNYIDTHFQGSQRFVGVEVEPDSCILTKKTLILKTIPTYHVISETICEGDDYIKNGFYFKNLPAGYIEDTIEVASDNRCKKWNVLKLNIVSNDFTPYIKGDGTPCMNKWNTYNVPGAYSCEWILPTNALPYDEGRSSDYTYLMFKDGSEGVISAKCSNGCVSKTVSMAVHPIQTTKTFVIDTICQGTSYEKDGWNLGVQNKLGYSTYIRQLGDSCGSADVLVLYVLQSPNLQVFSAPDIVCPGEQVKLTVVDKSADGYNDIAIGDVLCNDGTFLKLKDFLLSGKVAKGIVVEYDPNHYIHVLSIKDENNGELVPYDGVYPFDMDPNLIEGGDIFRKWFVLNKYLSQIDGADILDGLYWTNGTKDGTRDTHRIACGYVNGEFIKEPTPIENKCKIRYQYYIWLQQ